MTGKTGVGVRAQQGEGKPPSGLGQSGHALVKVVIPRSGGDQRQAGHLLPGPFTEKLRPRAHSEITGVKPDRRLPLPLTPKHPLDARAGPAHAPARPHRGPREAEIGCRHDPYGDIGRRYRKTRIHRTPSQITRRPPPHADMAHTEAPFLPSAERVAEHHADDLFLGRSFGGAALQAGAW
ncbi:hypothetical protein [Nonomuraea rosea]|uniref:hypothetical protein n=1 Tax=Nonomuraea rosea TaxID=638574 RepID=UPI0031EBAA9D